MQDRDRLLARSFVRLADTLVDDFDVVEFLHELCADVVQLVGAETAGVMLADTRGGLRLLASSEERMRVLEVFELQNQQGPCLDAYRTRNTVAATIDDGARLWPSFAPYAAELGFRYMCAVPLQLRDITLGALNLFRATNDPFAAGRARDRPGDGQGRRHRTPPTPQHHRGAPGLRTAPDSTAKPHHHRTGQRRPRRAAQPLRRRRVPTTAQPRPKHQRKLTDVARDVANKRVDASAFTAPTYRNKAGRHCI